MERVEYFKNIDTKEKAYIAGFILGDGHLNRTENNVEVNTCYDDREIIYFINEQLKEIPTTLTEKLETNLKQKKHPSCMISIRSKKEFRNLHTLYGGRLKNERRFPRVKSHLLPYFILGFFDAEGCITWGKRKDRDRIWQKVSFTSQLSILTGFQKILCEIGISTILRQKQKEDCFNLEFSNELDVFTIKQYLPTDCFRLGRKKNNFNKWLEATIEKYSFRKNDIVTFVDKRVLLKYSLPIESYIVKSCFKFIILNINKNLCTIKNLETNNIIDNVDVKFLSKQGISNYALRLKLGELLEGQINE